MMPIHSIHQFLYFHQIHASGLRMLQRRRSNFDNYSLFIFEIIVYVHLYTPFVLSLQNNYCSTLRCIFSFDTLVFYDTSVKFFLSILISSSSYVLFICYLTNSSAYLCHISTYKNTALKTQGSICIFTIMKFDPIKQ